MDHARKIKFSNCVYLPSIHKTFQKSTKALKSHATEVEFTDSKHTRTWFASSMFVGISALTAFFKIIRKSLRDRNQFRPF